jgi:hypothetical protein
MQVAIDRTDRAVAPKVILAQNAERVDGPQAFRRARPDRSGLALSWGMSLSMSIGVHWVRLVCSLVCYSFHLFYTNFDYLSYLK